MIRLGIRVRVPSPHPAGLLKAFTAGCRGIPTGVVTKRRAPNVGSPFARVVDPARRVDALAERGLGLANGTPATRATSALLFGAAVLLQSGIGTASARDAPAPDGRPFRKQALAGFEQAPAGSGFCSTAGAGVQSRRLISLPVIVHLRYLVAAPGRARVTGGSRSAAVSSSPPNQLAMDSSCICRFEPATKTCPNPEPRGSRSTRRKGPGDASGRAALADRPIAGARSAVWLAPAPEATLRTLTALRGGAWTVLQVVSQLTMGRGTRVLAQLRRRGNRS
jgi:hypothetical protein